MSFLDLTLQATISLVLIADPITRSVFLVNKMNFSAQTMGLATKSGI